MNDKKNPIPAPEDPFPALSRSKRPSGLVSTQNAAARKFSTTTKTLRAWRNEGADGFNPDGSIDLGKLGSWLEKRNIERGGTADSKEAKLLEEIRKLRIANDAKEGGLVKRAWVISKIQEMSGELGGFRSRSEAEHPMRFAAANGDVAQCRTVIRGIWDEILSSMQTLKKHLEEQS